MRFVAEVAGMPAPQGSKRHVGHGILIESSKKVAPWRDSVITAIHAAHDGPWPMFAKHEAVFVQLHFTLPAPKSVRKTVANFPSKIPDLDKLIRSTLDGVTVAGLWVDDGQAVSVFASKSYPVGVKGAGKYALDWPGVWMSIDTVSGQVT